MAKPNYDRVKRQKEMQRKQKKQEKLLKKQARATEGQPGETPGADGEAVAEIVALAPKLEFKNGKADKVWIKLKEVDGPEDIKGTAWLASGLEDKLGVFHAPLMKSINKFIHTQCPKRYGPGGEAAKEKPDKKPIAAASKPAEAAKAAPVAKSDTAKPDAEIRSARTR